MTAVDAIDASRMRQVMGRFCSGITVITSIDPDTGEPVGFTCQSFSSLSLDPPLILVAPSRRSTTWATIRPAAAFTVNILADHQESISSLFGRSGPDKFAGISWSAGATGAPRIDTSAAWVDCTIWAEHDGGDHTIVIGQVHELDVSDRERPLLYSSGRYARLSDSQ